MRTNIRDYMRTEFDDPFFEHWYDILYKYNIEKK